MVDFMYVAVGTDGKYYVMVGRPLGNGVASGPHDDEQVARMKMLELVVAAPRLASADERREEAERASEEYQRMYPDSDVQ